MSHKLTKLSLLLLMTVTVSLLTACTTTLNRNSMIERVVTAHKLSNGKTLKVGYKTPQSSWQCSYVGSESHNWSMQQMEGMVDFGGGYQKLRDTAVSYANSHRKAGVNYAFLDIPNQRSVFGINVTMMRKATINYYHCKNPPATNHNPF